MKKLAVVCVLGLLLSQTAMFARRNKRPDGFAVGLGFGFGGDWDNGYDRENGMGWQFLLKKPQLPLFWTLNLELGRDWLACSAIGDYYVIDEPIDALDGLGWFFGVGGYVSVFGFDNDAFTGTVIDLGVHAPIGINYRFDFGLELLLDVAVNIGLGIIQTGDFANMPHFPDGGWGIDFGARYWF
ncbi:hypothetical protein FACS1894200_14190 [Spirochaetia bacterium]|nr:hypothetical protein FACS1894200_14190 [Spirochaetia bacterium]